MNAIFAGGEGIKVEPVAAEVRARYGSYPVLSVTIDTTKYPTLQEITWYKVLYSFYGLKSTYLCFRQI